MIPAPGQGILACQGRAGESYEYLDAVRCEAAACCARAERGFSAELGGGCTVPVGAYAEIIDGELTLHGFLRRRSGRDIQRRARLRAARERRRARARPRAQAEGGKVMAAGKVWLVARARETRGC